MTLSERFRDALSYATEADAGQMHEGTPIPFRAHLLGVTGIALEYGADEGEAIAVRLHDAGEDAGAACGTQTARFLNGVRHAARPGRNQNRPPSSSSFS